jgi:NADH dehydrogenase
MVKQAKSASGLVDRLVQSGQKLVGMVTRRVEGKHQSETEADYLKSSTRILILGAGFGGLSTALNLDRYLDPAQDVSILVIDRNNYSLFNPLMWTVATGRTSPGSIVVPIRAFQRGRSFHVLHAEIQRIDLDEKLVYTSAGPRPYDFLVLGLGAVTAFPNLPGLKEYALPFHSPMHAMELRNHLIDAVEAAHQCEDAAEKAGWLTFVIGGGGDTGVELAATIREYLVDGLFKRYPWLADAPLRVVLIGRADRLVPMSTPSTSQSVRRVLEGEGIEVLTGVAVQGVTERAVQTSQGEIPTHTFFWAAGISAPPVIKELEVKQANNGALIVDKCLQIPGRPEVYVVGDIAWAFDAATNAPLPPTAQAAEHQGAYVAKALGGRLKGQAVEPFMFKPRGHLALLGKRTGVAEVGSASFTGMIAWLLWHGYYLSHIPSWRNRVQLLTNWFLAAFLGPETSQLRLSSPPQNLSRPE